MRELFALCLGLVLLTHSGWAGCDSDLFDSEDGGSVPSNSSFAAAAEVDYVTIDVPLTLLTDVFTKGRIPPHTFTVKDRLTGQFETAEELVVGQIVNQRDSEEPIALGGEIVRFVYPITLLDRRDIFAPIGKDLVPFLDGDIRTGNTSLRRTLVSNIDGLRRAMVAAEGFETQIAFLSSITLDEALEIWVAPSRQNRSRIIKSIHLCTDPAIRNKFLFEQRVFERTHHPLMLPERYELKTPEDLAEDHGFKYLAVRLSLTDVRMLMSGRSLTANKAWVLVHKNNLRKKIPGFEAYDETFFHTHTTGFNPVPQQLSEDSILVGITPLASLNTKVSLNFLTDFEDRTLGLSTYMADVATQTVDRTVPNKGEITPRDIRAVLVPAGAWDSLIKQIPEIINDRSYLRPQYLELNELPENLS